MRYNLNFFVSFADKSTGEKITAFDVSIDFS